MHFLQAIYHSHFSWPDFVVLTLGAGVTAYQSARSSEAKPLVAGAGTGMLLNLPLGVLLIHAQLSAPAISRAEVWREAVLYALLLAAGAAAGLFGAHAILAARKA